MLIQYDGFQDLSKDADVIADRILHPAKRLLPFVTHPRHIHRYRSIRRGKVAFLCVHRAMNVLVQPQIVYMLFPTNRSVHSVNPQGFHRSASHQIAI
jgi:hypothetical protein